MIIKRKLFNSQNQMMRKKYEIIITTTIEFHIDSITEKRGKDGKQKIIVLLRKDISSPRPHIDFFVILKVIVVL